MQLCQLRLLILTMVAYVVCAMAPPTGDKPTEFDENTDHTGSQSADHSETVSEPPPTRSDVTDPSDAHESTRTDTDVTAPVETQQPEDAIEPSSARQSPAIEETAETGMDAPVSVVDSNWWYWVAAVPLYVVGGIIGSILVGILFLFTITIDVIGAGGIATGLFTVIVVLVAAVFGLFGIALLFLFPIGIYLDAKEITDADVDWEPDAVLYGLMAAGSAFLTAFTLSLIVALYYLYRRHQYLDEP